MLLSVIKKAVLWFNYSSLIGTPWNTPEEQEDEATARALHKLIESTPRPISEAEAKAEAAYNALFDITSQH